MNKELVVLLLKFAGVLVIVMGLILLCCVVTPRLARKIEKKLPQDEDDPESKSEDGVKPEDYEVQGMFDPQKLDEYDLNYKIYNKDIYGVDFKHGKRKKRKDG
ncbi:MAG: hypothetical protein II574_09875 [Ruminococcus sp.]|nr:hypothetical protein [Ruminococcus sp.]